MIAYINRISQYLQTIHVLDSSPVFFQVVKSREYHVGIYCVYIYIYVCVCACACEIVIYMVG